jgi:hypothetical protein
MRRWVGWVAWPVAVAAVLALEFALLGDRIAADVALVLDGPRAATTAAPVDVLPALPQTATAAVAPLRAADLRALPGCVPGGDCRVRVQVVLDPVAPGTAAELSWSVRADDLCTGAASAVGSGSATVPPGADRLDLVATVGVPAGSAVALTAVASTPPATVASEPVRVPATGRCGS